MKRALAGAGLTIGLTQMNSILEAAEFVSAPNGFSIDAALSPAGRGALAPRILAVTAVVAAAIMTAVMIWPRSTNGAAAAAPSAAAPSRSGERPAPVETQVPAPTPPAVPAPPPVQEGTGQVVDADGKPVPGALVFPGRWYRLRGDDAFDPFRPELIKDGVTTDAEGRFRLETKAPFVSAWHSDHSPTTVAAADAATIRIRARGKMRGRIVDGERRPREGVEVLLDKRGPKATTDGEGRFQFEKVIAGIRGVILDQRRWVAVRVEPGESLSVDIGPGVDVTLDLSDHPSGPGTSLNGGLMGVGRTTSLLPIRGTTPSLELKGVLPGRYWFGEVRGARGWVDIGEKEAKVTFGKASVEISADEAVEFFLLPAEHNEIIEAALMKMGLSKAGPGAPVKMIHLLEGDYEIRNRDGVTLEKVTLGPGETRVTLKAK